MMPELTTLAGIDFGAKLAGTTSMTILQHSKFKIHDCKKGDNADDWILEQIEKHTVSTVFIDATLSLPPAYFDHNSNEFFYRKADADLGAMSPMFLGGLTARAMKLKRILESRNITVFETYPAALVRELLPHSKFYKKDIPAFRKALSTKTKLYDLPSLPPFKTFHQVDSLLAWVSGFRHITRQFIVHGSKEEGEIFI